ncbi:MAG: hypothetical protein NVS1B14_13020 [Vulcanimicrobiaceae bacterium]
MTTLKQVIEAAVEAQPDVLAENIAIEVYGSKRDLIEDWMFKNLLRLTRAAKSALLKKTRTESQLFLPGFAKLTRKLPLRKGSIVVRDATISKLKQFVKLEAKRSPAVIKTEALIKAMRPYARNRHGLTVGQFYELRALKSKKLLTPARESAVR